MLPAKALLHLLGLDDMIMMMAMLMILVRVMVIIMLLVLIMMMMMMIFFVFKVDEYGHVEGDTPAEQEVSTTIILTLQSSS